MTSELTIRVNYACGLRAADSNGKSDPYVKVLLLKKGQEKPTLLHTTPVIYKTLDAEWEAEGGTVPPCSHLNHEDVIIFEVWDKDRITSDDFLGFVRIRVGDTPPFSNKLDIKLRGEHRDTSGTIGVELCRTDEADKGKQVEPLAKMVWKSDWREKQEALLKACGMNPMDKVDEDEAEKLILQRGPEGDDTLDLKTKDSHGRSALHFAAGQGASEKLIRLLVEKVGLDPDERMTGTGGYAPVHVAAINGKTGAIRVLKAVGADLDRKTTGDMYGGFTAAHCCYQYEKLDSLKVLKELGAKINLADKEGEKLRDKVEEDMYSKFTKNKAEWLAVFDS